MLCKGYAANIEEMVDRNSSVLTDYRVDKKTHTDNYFLKEAPDALADFKFNEDETRLLKCATGHEPISQSYTKTTRKCIVSFDRDHCAGCPYHDQCHLNKSGYFYHLKKASNGAKIQRYMQGEEFSDLARLKNGVETIPASIRKNYYLDKLPRKNIGVISFFGSKIATRYFRKLFGSQKSLGNYAQNPILVQNKSGVY